jgi:hypothetical protein
MKGKKDMKERRNVKEGGWVRSTEGRTVGRMLWKKGMKA